MACLQGESRTRVPLFSESLKETLICSFSVSYFPIRFHNLKTHIPFLILISAAPQITPVVDDTFERVLFSCPRRLLTWIQRQRERVVPWQTSGDTGAGSGTKHPSTSQKAATSAGSWACHQHLLISAIYTHTVCAEFIVFVFFWRYKTVVAW